MKAFLRASPLKDEVHHSREPSARSAAVDSGGKAASMFDVLLRGQHWIVKRWSYAFSHRWAHPGLCLKGGWGKWEWFDVAARSEPPKLRCQSHKQRQLRPSSGPSKDGAHHTRTKDSEHWAKNIVAILCQHYFDNINRCQKYRKKESN